MDIIIDGPFKNALGTEVMQNLRKQLREANGEPLLLRGQGDAFSAGLNLKEVLTLDTPRALAFLDLLEALVTELYEHPAPVVAYVNGHAIAGGAVLALACDHRVAAAAPSARIGLNEVALGVSYPPRVIALIRARLPRLAQREVVLGAGLFAPLRARELGLCDEVADDAERVARERLAALAKHPRDAYRAAKRALGEGGLEPAPGERERFEREALPIWSSVELRERIRATLVRK